VKADLEHLLDRRCDAAVAGDLAEDATLRVDVEFELVAREVEFEVEFRRLVGATALPRSRIATRPAI
jgi:hypothetical protein